MKKIINAKISKNRDTKKATIFACFVFLIKGFKLIKIGRQIIKL